MIYIKIKKIKPDLFPYKINGNSILSLKTKNKKCNHIKIYKINKKTKEIIVKKEYMNRKIKSENGELILTRLNGVYIYPVYIIKKENFYVFKLNGYIKVKKYRNGFRLIINQHVNFLLPERSNKIKKYNGVIEDISQIGIKLITQIKILNNEEVLILIKNKKIKINEVLGKVVRKRKVFDFNNKKYIKNNFFEYGIKIIDNEQKKNEIATFLMNKQRKLKNKGYFN